MRRALHIALKDIKVWTRDIAALGVLLAMPVILIMILGSAFGSGGQTAIKVAIVNLDEGVTTPFPGEPPTSSKGYHENVGQELVDLVLDNPRLSEAFDVDTSMSEAEARKAVGSGDLIAALVVPERFSEQVHSGEPAELEVVKDPGSELSAGIWESVVQGLAAEYSAASVGAQTAFAVVTEQRPELIATEQGSALVQQRSIQGVTDDESPVEIVDGEAEVDREIAPIDYYAISMSAMFLMFGSMFGAFSTIKERREQTLSRLLSTPTAAASVTGGKMLGIFGLGMVQFTVLYLATRFVFGVEWGSDVLATFAVAAAEMLAVTGFAVLIAALAKSERGAGGIAPLTIQVQALLGGAFFSIAILPAWLQPIRYTSVIGWAMEGFQEIQLRDGGIGDVLGPIAALLGFAVVLFAVGTVLAGRRR